MTDHVQRSNQLSNRGAAQAIVPLLRIARGACRSVHPYPVAIVVATATVLVVIAHGGSPGWRFLARAVAVVLASQVAVGALNDYVDRERDAHTQPNKPIPAGEVPARLVLGVTIVSLMVLVALAATFGAGPACLALAGTGAGIAYDLWLKPTPLSAVGYLVGFLSLITWAWVIAGRLSAGFLLVYPGNALMILAAHLANAYPDLESDSRLGQHGLAAVLGPRGVYRTVFASYGCVLIGGVAIACLERRYLALAALSLSALIGVIAAFSAKDAPRNRAIRVRMFHMIAPGLACMATGCFLVIAGP